MKKNMRKMLTLLAAGVLVLLMAVPSFAQPSYNAVQATGKTVTITKDLELNGATSVPTGSATFTITPDATGSTAAKPITAGPALPAAEASKTISFSSADDSSIASDKVRKTATVNLASLSFTLPGIYRYKVEETAVTGGCSKKSGGDYVRYIDIYVSNVNTAGGQSALQVSNVVLHSGAAIETETGKNDPFVNEFKSQKLTISKAVTGNQGDKTKMFSFTVEITGGTAGSIYKLTKTGQATGPDTITASGSPVKATATITMNDADSVVIDNLPIGATWKVTEGTATGYTQKVAVDGGTQATAVEGTGTITDGKDSTAAFENNKQGTVPTGIFLNYKPFWLMGAVALILLVVLMSRRRNRYSDEI